MLGRRKGRVSCAGVARATWAKGVLPLKFKPAYSVCDLLLQHLDALEHEAEEKGGVQQVLADHFAKVYKVNLPLTEAA
jgi:hypothetical protein